MSQTTGELLEAIMASFAYALDLPVDEVTPDTEYFSAGGGSLRALVLLRDLERDLHLKVPRQRFWLGMTPRELAGCRIPDPNGEV